MATVKIDLSLEDTKGTIRRRKDEVQDLNKELEKANRFSKSAKPVSQAVKSSYGAGMGIAGGENQEYNRARGSMGGTGASGRDFARQAQGLDGLVRLYAVYAANVFAVGAAFTALSNAMDTTNMVKGLDQLGAASGVAMGALAKQFSAASGGAISLRESMEATAKAVSSGLSQAQFLKLGEVAKKASQALGVNMSDAVSRLTRGITKLEPELLDELGIFTKVGKATEDYARSVGKSANSLTDFERRQAFANAVLDEGAKKFGDINVDTNPYSKLLATLKDVAQSGLEIVNTVLAPFAKLLSSNTSVLVGALALVGVKLVTDALPAIMNWRKGIKDAATQADISSTNIVESFGEKFVESTNNAFKVPQLQKNLKSAEDDYAKSREKFLQIDGAYTAKQKKNKFYSTMATGGEISPASMEREITRLKKEGTTASLQEVAVLQKMKAQYADILQLRGKVTDAENAAQARADRPSAGEYLRSRVSRSAASRSERLNILSNVSTNAAEGGFGYAMGQLGKEISSSKNMGGIAKFRTAVTGAMIAGANAVGLFVSAFSGIFTAIGLVSAAFSFIVPMFRKNEEAASRFAASIDEVKDSNENAYRVMERLSKVDPLERLSIPALQAKAVALEGLGGSLVKALDDFEKEVSTRNWADSTVNFIAGVFGKNAEEKLSAQLTTSIERAVQLAGSSSEASKIKQELAKVLSLPAGSGVEAITAAVDQAEPVIKKQVSKLVQNIGKEALRGTGSFTAFNESLVESGKIYQDLLGTFKNSTPLTKFAEDSTKKLLELTKVLETGTVTQQLRELSDLSQNMTFLQLLPVGAAKEILAVSGELANLNTQYSESENYIKDLNSAVEYYNSLLKEEQSKGAGLDFGANAKALAQAVRQLNQAIGEQKNLQSGIGARLTEASGVFSKAIGTALVANIDSFTKGLQSAAAKASLELKKTYLEGVSDPRIKAKLETDIARKSIAVEMALVKSQISLIDSNAQLRLALMEVTQATNVAKVTKPGETLQQVLAKPENEGLKLAQETIDKFRDSMGKSIGQIRKEILGEGSTGAKIGLGEGLATAQAKASVNAQLVQLAEQDKNLIVRGRFQELDAKAQVDTKAVDDKIARAQSDKAKLALDRKSLTDEEYQIKESSLNVRLAELEATKMLIGPERDLAKAQFASKAFIEDAPQILKYAKEQLTVVTGQAEEAESLARKTAENNVNLATGSAILENTRKTTSDKFDKELQSLSTQIELNGAEQALLQTKQSLQMVTEEEFKTQSDILTKANLQLTSARELLQARSAAADKLAEINKRELEAGGPGKASLKTQAELDADRAKVLSDLAAQETGINKVREARLKDIDLIAAQTLRQTAYTDLFNGAFKSMEDAILEFTKTGKLSFSSMIDNFIEGLIRFELQQQQMALLKGVGGAGGLAQLFIGQLSGVGREGSNSFVGPLQSQSPLMLQAKGGAWDYGVQAFAKGGAFTNQIVDSPTLFKFARGTGLMGEAGPEAIMPLKRDSNGNLGVSNPGGGGNVEVVINNYSTAQAETRETTDSRGNRRIEVIVGDMVAQEVAKTGSATQNAFSSTYGTRPALARR
jgi:hypothetical protein